LNAALLRCRFFVVPPRFQRVQDAYAAAADAEAMTTSQNEVPQKALT
jgi:hypothetical protein